MYVEYSTTNNLGHQQKKNYTLPYVYGAVHHLDS